jgi:HlyD family secretion protein
MTKSSEKPTFSSESSDLVQNSEQDKGKQALSSPRSTEKSVASDSTDSEQSTKQIFERKGTKLALPPAKKNQGWLPLLISLGVISFGAVALHMNATNRPEGAPPVASTPPRPSLTVTVQPVISKSFPKTLSVSGSLAAWDELPLAAEASGLRIDNIYVDEGDRVRKGQVLATLNNQLLKAQMQQSEARVSKAMSGIRQQQAAIREAEALKIEADRNFKRYDNLVREGAISQQEAQSRQTSAATSQARVDSARQSLAVAQSDLAAAKADLQEFKARMSQTQIVAPVDGFISKRQAKLGSVTSGSSASSSALFTMVRDGRIELNAEVSELDLPGIKPGQPVVISSDADPSKRYTGRVREVAPVVDAQTRIGLVRIKLPPNPELRPGMFVRGQLRLGSAPAVVVPETALLFKDGKPFVFVVKGEPRQGGTAQATVRLIQTGARDAGFVEVRSGLRTGEQIILSGAGYLKDGDTVRIGSLDSASGGRP